MDRQSVQSSNVAEIGYDVASATLEVAFRNGSAYQYFDVPENTYQELMRADSIGSYFNRQIKNHYRSTKI